MLEIRAVIEGLGALESRFGFGASKLVKFYELAVRPGEHMFTESTVAVTREQFFEVIRAVPTNVHKSPEARVRRRCVVVLMRQQFATVDAERGVHNGGSGLIGDESNRSVG